MNYNNIVRSQVAKKTKENPKGAGRTKSSITIEKIESACRMGSKAVEIASLYHCSVDTILNRIKSETEFSNFSEFKEYCQEGGKAILRNFAYTHAKQSADFCKFMLINQLPDEYRIKPINSVKDAPRIQLVDSKEDADYTTTLQSKLKQLDDTQARLLLIDTASLLPHQREFITAKEQIVAMVAGFGAGKTYGFTRAAIYNAFTKITTNRKKNRSRGLIVYPTLALADELFVAPMIELLEELQISYRYNKKDMVFLIEGMASIKVYTLEKGERIVGSEYTYAMIDELDTVPMAKAKKAFEMITGRLRGIEDAQLFIVTTPEGFRFTYDLMITQVQKKPELASQRRLIKAKTTDNPYLPKSYIKKLRDNYDPKMLDQYLNGEFVNLNGSQAYYGFNRDNHVKTLKRPVPKDLFIGIDFNVNPMTATIWEVEFEYTEEEKRIGHAYCHDEIILKNSNTRSMAEAIKNIYPDNMLTFFPDPSGRSRHSSSNIGITDISILEEYGKCMYVNRVPEKDKLNTTNNLLSKNKITINRKCGELIMDYEQIVINDSGVIDKSDQKRTHTSDGAGYLFYMLDFINIRLSRAY